MSKSSQWAYEENLKEEEKHYDDLKKKSNEKKLDKDKQKLSDLSIRLDKAFKKIFS